MPNNTIFVLAIAFIKSKRSNKIISLVLQFNCLELYHQNQTKSMKSPDYLLLYLYIKKRNQETISSIYNQQKRMNITKNYSQISTGKSKKSIEAIQKHKYYKQSLFPNIFLNNISCDLVLNTATNQHQMTYFYSESQQFQVNAISPQLFKNVLIQCYNQASIVKFGNNFFKEKKFKVPYLPIYYLSSEILEFCEETNQQCIFQLPSKNKKQQLIQSQDKCSNQQFDIYVIHYYHDNENIENKIKWNQFVQHYKVKQLQMKYTLICSANIEYSYLDISKNLEMSLLKQFLQQYSHKQKIQKFIANLYKKHQIYAQEKMISNDPAFSQEHIRLKKLPGEYHNIYSSLRKYFSLEISDNKICRYLIAYKYNLSQTKQALIESQRWTKEMKQKYHSLKDFQQFVDMDIFTYVGQDYHGRPVILNKAAHVYVDRMDLQKYCDYFLYFIQIQTVSKMRGFVDQYIVIADVGDLGTDNFKFSITKRNVSESLKYCPQRQLKMIGVNVSNFARYCWYFIRPLLPASTLSKIVVAGNKTEEILETLEKEMSIEIIPEYLGGNNNSLQNLVKQENIIIN